MAFDYTDAVFSTPLIRAVIRNNKDEVLEALNQGFSANLPDNRGWTPLHEAAHKDERVNCLKELIVHCTSNINAQTFLGESPLFLACLNDCTKAVKTLLKQSKCNVNQTNSEGVSPLHVACSRGNMQIVSILIVFGAEINSQDFNGYSPLHETVASGNGNCRDDVSFEICQHLLNHGANPDILEYEGNYPFHFACQNGLTNCVNLLYSSSKQRDLVDFCNNDGRSPLMMAVQSQNLTVIEALLSHGANPNIADKANVTALHLAAHTANYHMFNMIQKATSHACIIKYCTFHEERDFEQFLHNKRINSLICLAIDTEDLKFLTTILESNFDQAILQCPVIHAENLVKKSFTLHTPVSFLLESKMYDLGERTLDFLQTLIDHKSPLKVTSKNRLINYINPICAALVALNDCPLNLVLKCLKMLLSHGADSDEPYGRMPFAMEQACMRGCVEAVLVLLQCSNVLEPEDLLKWIEEETSSDQEKIVEILLPLAPYYTPSDRLLPDLIDTPRRKTLLAPRVHPLTSYCRTVIRRELHKESKAGVATFKEKLSDLILPKDLCLFINYV